MVLAIPVTALAGPAAVEIHGYAYHAPEVTVSAGEPVTWTNLDPARHDVSSTAGPEAFASPELAEGESFTFTFTQPGGYGYLCTLHPDMVGSVLVTAAATIPAAVGAAPEVAAPATPVTPADPVEPVQVPQLAASPRDDPALASAARPYLLHLAIVAIAVSACLVVLGTGRREGTG